MDGSDLRKKKHDGPGMSELHGSSIGLSDEYENADD
jgi:hypothetical protein